MNTHTHPISHPLNHRLAALSLALFLATSAGVHASTIVVTNTADSGPGSLRDALASSADGDTIDATGVAGTILLTTGHLVVSKSVTILGPGPATLSVDGNAASRVFSSKAVFQPPFPASPSPTASLTTPITVAPAAASSTITRR